MRLCTLCSSVNSIQVAMSETYDGMKIGKSYNGYLEVVVSVMEGDMSTNLELIGFFGTIKCKIVDSEHFPAVTTGCYFDL